MNTTVQTLIGKGFINVTYSNNLKQATSRLLRAWEEFLKLPFELKNTLQYSNNWGYERKQDPGKTNDLKEDFHISRIYAENLTSASNPVFKELALASLGTFNSIEDALKPILQDLEEIVPGITEEILQNHNDLILRLLWYPPQETETLAVAHVDKGSSTMHLVETNGGLQYLDLQSKKWKDVELEVGYGVFFPGFQGQFVSENVLTGLWHRVVNTEQAKTEGRISIVLFQDLKSKNKYNKEFWGRTQDLPEGYNYRMPFDVVKQHFTAKKYD